MIAVKLNSVIQGRTYSVGSISDGKRRREEEILLDQYLMGREEEMKRRLRSL